MCTHWAPQISAESNKNISRCSLKEHIKVFISSHNGLDSLKKCSTLGLSHCLNPAYGDCQFPSWCLLSQLPLCANSSGLPSLSFTKPQTSSHRVISISFSYLIHFQVHSLQRLFSIFIIRFMHKTWFSLTRWLPGRDKGWPSRHPNISVPFLSSFSPHWDRRKLVSPQG